MGYARGTEVSVDRSIAEMRGVLTKYKAQGFAYGERTGQAAVNFEMGGRRVRFILPLPVFGEMMTKRDVLMTRNQIENEAKRRWRCLLLAIKAKLECVESGITTFENEFMAHIVLPNNKTVGEVMIPQIDSAYSNGKMPPLLGYDE